MPIIRLTAFFQTDDGYGWSEQHCVDGGSVITSLQPFLNTFDGIISNLRRPMLGGDAFYIGARAAYRTTGGKIASAPLVKNPGMRGQQTYMGEDTFTTAQEVAAKLRFANITSTAFSDVYLRGLWDQVENAGVLNFTSKAGAGWKALALAYVAGLQQANYGWEGIDPALTSRGDVSAYVSNPDGTITFTVAPTNNVALPVPPSPGIRYSVRFARLNHSKSVLNRTLVCTVVSPTSLKTVQVVSASDFETAGTYVLPVTGFILYGPVAYWKLARRACGRPFGLTRGRAPVRALS